MKKSALILALLLASFGCHAQKSKKPKPKAKPVAAASKSMAKADNVSVEFDPAKDGLLYLSVNGSKTDTLHVRRTGIGAPTDVAIKPISCNGSKLYCVTWTENRTTGDVKTKQENLTQKRTEIVDVEAHAKVLSNTESANHIIEKVYLTSDKAVSETQEKLRREGMELVVLADGDLELRNKNSKSKLTYVPADKKFIAKK